MGFVTNLTGTLSTGIFVEGYPSGSDNDGGVVGTPLAGRTIGIYAVNSPLKPATITSDFLPDTPQPSGTGIERVRGGDYNVLDGDYIVIGTGAMSDSANRVYAYVQAISVPLYGTRIREGAWQVYSGVFDPALISVASGIYNIGNNTPIGERIRDLKIDTSNIFYL